MERCVSSVPSQTVSRHLGQTRLPCVHGHLPKASNIMTDTPPHAATVSEITEMALSDHVSFDLIRAQHGLGPDQVKALMRTQLKPGSYRAWRKRVRTFSDRREVYN